jgi:uncharacterized protein (TIGR02996 family)
MTPDRAAGFVHAILAEPDADDHRLIFADYLEDHGDPEFSAFIRLQVRLAHTCPENDVAWYADHDRAQELLARREMEWTGELKKLVPAGVFRRGFVERVTLSARQFLEQGEQLFALAPIREVQLRDVGDYLTPLFASPLLARLRGLDLSCRVLGERAIARLCDSPHLEGLVSLNLGNNEIGLAGLRRLLHAKNLPGLRELDLHMNGLGSATLDVLQEGPLPGQLKSLNLSQNVFGAGGGPRLATFPTLSSLRQLGLARLQLTQNGLRRLVRSPHLANIEDLDVGDNTLRSDGLETLLEHCRLPRLRSLNLSGWDLRRDNLDALASTDRLGDLKKLSLRWNHRIDNLGLVSFLTGTSFPALRWLDMRGCWFDHTLVPTLRALHNRPLRPLHALELSVDNLSAEGRASLRGLYPPGVVRLI